MSKLLPPIFADAMAENAQSAVTLFEGTHERAGRAANEALEKTYLSREMGRISS